MNNYKYFSLETIEKLMARVGELLQKYEYESNYHKGLEIKLANGDFIKFRVYKNQVPHMLGFKMEAIPTSLYNESNIYFLLKKWVANPTLLYNLCKKGTIKYENLISDYIDSKLDAFLHNCFFDDAESEINSIDLVIKYDKTKAFGIDGSLYDFNYSIKKHDRSGNIYYVELVKQVINRMTGAEAYVPRSSMMFKSEEEFSAYIKEKIQNQVLTYPVSVKTIPYNSEASFHYLRYKLKKEALDYLTELASYTGADVVSCVDHQYLITKYIELTYSGSLLNKDFVDIMIYKMNRYEIISPNDFGVNSFSDLNNFLVAIIRGYNATVQQMIKNSKSNSNYDEIGRLRDKIDILNEKIRILEAEKDEQNAVIEEMKKTNAQISQQNEELKEKIENYDSAFGSIQRVLDGRNDKQKK